MKKLFVITSFLMSGVILFSILFQSVDSYEHLAKKNTEKNCHHNTTTSSQINHQHFAFEDCFVCDFSFSNYFSSTILFIERVTNIEVYKSNTFFVNISNSFFQGISYSLRGPPSL